MATYNLVYSVKGGCGKTTFSIWMAYYLNMLSEMDYETAVLEEKNKEEAEIAAIIDGDDDKADKARLLKREASERVKKYEAVVDTTVLIDMDLLGTSMLVAFNGDSKCHTAVTNDIFKRVTNVKKEFVNKVILKNGRHINVIFSSMEYSERHEFKSGRHAGYTPVVKHGIFRSGLRELIKNNKTIDGKTVQHFIFDMPPNSDGFSDAAMECVFSRKYTVADAGDRKNLFVIIGIDWGQTLATIAELRMLLRHNDEGMPDRIFIVMNQNMPSVFDEKCYTIRKAVIEEELRASWLHEKEKNSIFFLKVFHNEKFAQLGVGGEQGGIGLKNADISVLSDVLPKGAVIAAYAPYGGEFQDTTSDKETNILRKLILGEENEQG